MLEEGLRVKMNPEHSEYKEFLNQHKGNEGVVTHRSVGEERSWVRWSHGHENSYADDALIILDEAYLKKQKEENKIYELPFFPGTRVCPNPESDYFEYLSKLGEKGAANVIVLANNSDLKQWRYIKNKAIIPILIKFDNGKVASCLHRDVLSVDTKPRNVIRFIYDDGTTATCFADETETLNKIYSRIIKNQEILTSKIEYDDEWRAITTQQIINNSIDVK